jgi:hypothetical protein
MSKDPYVPPTSNLDNIVAKSTKPTEFIVWMAVILTVVTFTISYRSVAGTTMDYAGTPEKLGGALAFIIVSAFLVLPFQAFGRFRNNKSRLKIYNWFMSIFTLLTIIMAMTDK